MGNKLLSDSSSLSEISSESDIGNACLSILEDDVFELLHIPAGSSENLEAVGKNTNFI